MLISFYPLNFANQYIKNIVHAICNVNELITIKPLQLKKIHGINSVDFFWLNWYEDLGSKSYIVVIRTFIVRLLYFLLMQRAKGKIILVVHNKISHDTSHKKLSIFFLRYLLIHSDRVIVLCNDTVGIINKIAKRDMTYKIRKVLHPAYACSPKRYEIESRQQFKILFIGLVRPYKNIELLIDIAKIHPEVQFIISGKPITQAYASILKQRMRGLSNVSLDLKYNTDEELERLMDDATVLVLPYHLESTLNSGVAMYAFSKGINVIMPALGTVNELKNKDKVFSYEYQNENDHFDILDKKIREAYNLFIDNYAEFVKRAVTVRSEVLDRCSLSSITAQIELSRILDLESYN